MKKIILINTFLCVSFYHTSLFAKIKWPMILMEHQMASEVVVIFHEDSYSPKKITLKSSSGTGFFKNSKVKNPFGIPCCIHEATFTNLKPAETYNLDVKGLDKNLWFKTAGKTGKVFLGGDSRSDSSMRRKINKTIANYLEKNPSTYALIHGGDYVENGFSWGQWDSWLTDYQLTTTKSGRLLPIIPIRGNHEYLSFYFNHLFSRPSDRIFRNYYTTYWDDLRFIHLNTNLSHRGRQKEWLCKELELQAKEAKWIIPNYHRPAYPAVKTPGEARRSWVPLFEKHKVDVVFESDGHVYKKTAPIFKEKVDTKRGIRYLGEGGLGVPLRNPEKGGAWYFHGDGQVDSRYHFFVLEKQPSKLFIQAIDGEGVVFDSVHLAPRNRAK